MPTHIRILQLRLEIPRRCCAHKYATVNFPSNWWLVTSSYPLTKDASQSHSLPVSTIHIVNSKPWHPETSLTSVGNNCYRQRPCIYYIYTNMKHIKLIHLDNQWIGTFICNTLGSPPHPVIVTTRITTFQVVDWDPKLNLKALPL